MSSVADIQRPAAGATADFRPSAIALWLAVTAAKLMFAYLVLLAVSAHLGQWTPDYLKGRDLWHFTLSRMVVPMVMLGVVAAFVRTVPAALMLAVTLLIAGTISAIKKEATGEPIQVSDFFLAGQSTSLFGYVGLDKWLIGALIVPAAVFSALSLRVRAWSIPVLLGCVGLLSTYRFEAVANYIHDNAWRIGVENLTFSQAESERMNGIATHLYFSTAGLRLKTYTDAEVRTALYGLDADPAPPVRSAPAPDIFIVLGEAWWRDPTDKQPPLDRLTKAGFVESTAVSPVYGGTTPNAEFEVLTGVPAKSFQAGIIPYQHYLSYFTEQMRSLPRLLSEQGYEARAFHNFDRRFWLRDKVYPRFGFASFDSKDEMKVSVQSNGWPTDDGLYARVLERLGNDERPQFNFLVTVATHGPFKENSQSDTLNGTLHPGISDYHGRLSAAVDSLLAFEQQLKKRGRPFVLIAFGDHLPGLRLHQWKSGMKKESDPRLHQVPLLLASNSENVGKLRDRLKGRPLYCIAPNVADWLKLGIKDRYFRHVAKRCESGSTVGYQPPEPVIQNQLFAQRPITR